MFTHSQGRPDVRIRHQTSEGGVRQRGVTQTNVHFLKHFKTPIMTKYLPRSLPRGLPETFAYQLSLLGPINEYNGHWQYV